MRTITDKPTVAVVVLGDFGHSPRMQYHSMSMASHKFKVHVVAYKGSDPHETIRRLTHIELHYMKNAPKFENYPKLIVYILKTLWQSLFLFFSLLILPKLNCILLQNPPSVPALPVVYFASLLKRCDFIIDFHNYGYTILSLSLGRKHIFVRMCKWCEMYFGKKASKIICVSKAMKDDLRENWNLDATVFYDCAPDLFHPITVEEKHELFKTLGKEYEEFVENCDEENEWELTTFTRKLEILNSNQEKSLCSLRSDRPALVVSSTSWTEDEDFSILLKALERYEEVAKQTTTLPNLLVAITGKGPLKSFYEEKIAERGFSRIKIITLWLTARDYPKFLACADIGISLHSSSSGVDLPMKVVDMFGCCLPVCAYSFKSIDELVQTDINGLIFSSSHQLNQQLQQLLSNFPMEEGKLLELRNNLLHSKRLDWQENWNHTIHNMFTSS